MKGVSDVQPGWFGCCSLCQNPAERGQMVTEPVSQLISRAREAQGRSQQRLADLLNQAADNPDAPVTRHDVSRWERGVRRPTYWLPFLAEILDVPLEKMERATAIGRSARGRTRVESGDMLTAALSRTPVDLAALDLLEESAFGYAAKYPAAGPNGLLGTAEEQMRSLTQLLSHPMPGRVRRRVARVLTLLAGVVGHLYVDLGANQRAGGLFAAGRLAGEEAEDDDMKAWLIATESIPAFYEGRIDEAVGLLEVAGQHARRSSTTRRQAWISAMHARAHAAAAEPTLARNELDRAHALMSRTSDAPVGNDFFDAARLDGMTGTIMLSLRDTTRAESMITQALDARDPADAKGRALLTLDLAGCRLSDDEPMEAAHLVGRALDLADGTLVQPIATKALQVRAAMTRWDDSKPAIELDERLTHALGRARKAL